VIWPLNQSFISFLFFELAVPASNQFCAGCTVKPDGLLSDHEFIPNLLHGPDPYEITFDFFNEAGFWFPAGLERDFMAAFFCLVDLVSGVHRGPRGASGRFPIVVVVAASLIWHRVCA